MKLTRLDSTTQFLAPEAAERARQAAAPGQRRVEAMEGVAGDRRAACSRKSPTAMHPSSPRAKATRSGAKRPASSPPS